MKKHLILTAISLLTIGLSATAFSQFASNISLKTEMKDVYGTVNVPVYIKCDSEVLIINKASSNKRYTLGTKICTQNKQCNENKSEILVRAGKQFKNSYYTIFEPSFSRAGQKPIQCTNFVYGSENASQVKDALVFIS